MLDRKPIMLNFIGGSSVISCQNIRYVVAGEFLSVMIM